MGESGIDALWREIGSITPPEPIFLASTDDLELAPMPAPAGLSGPAPVGLWSAWGAVAGATVALAIQAPQLSLFALLPAAGAATWQLVRSRHRRRVLRQRRAVLAEVRRSHGVVIAEVNRAGPARFAEQKERLRRLKQEYETEVPRREERALAAFETKAQPRQLQRHLESSNIRDAVISGLGPGRKATLIQHGITNAAKVRAERVEALPGFGPGLTSAVLAWQQSRVRAFRYKPLDPVTARERAGVVVPFDARRQAIRLELQGGLDDLRRRSRMPAHHRLELARRLAAAARAVQQAELDVSAVKHPLALALPTRLGYRTQSCE